jgi:thiol-disulfide isomerase/thioredoxin/sugar lactone lactonase YvrE
VRATARVRAPGFRGRRWLNTGGREIGPEELRGRIVLLDFWSAGCVNCLRVLDELRALEERHGDVLTVLGVHSPKFAHEAESDAVAAAVRRYGVDHPVLDDADLVTWDAYAARAWPTLVLVDPRGYVVAQVSGEGHGPGLSSLVDELVAEHGDALRRGPLFTGAPADALPDDWSALRFPGKAVTLADGTILVSDSGHHRLVELEPDLVGVRRIIGAGRGLRDGAAATALFAEPLGLAVLPAAVAATVGYDVVIADSANHVLRGVRLRDGAVSTVAGTGTQLRARHAVGTAGLALATPLSTPWDVAWWEEQVVVAMAGCHQLWSFDPLRGTVAVSAGTGDEGLRDGAPHEAFFAQPSGLAVDHDGTLWVADAESSALRAVVTAPRAGAAVTTAVGQGLFDFGLRDGPGLGSAERPPALLQHPTGVAVLPDGSVAVADTYNGGVRRYDPVSREVTTLAEGLDEPTDVGLDGATVRVVESAAHRLVRLPLPARMLTDAPAGPEAVRATLAGSVTLRVLFTPPHGQGLDDRFGDPTSLSVAASPAELLVGGGGTAPGLQRSLRLAGPGVGTLHVEVLAAACDHTDSGETSIFAACHVYRHAWDVAVTVATDGASMLDLPLRPVG